MIFHLKLEKAQNLVGQQHERDFHVIFHFKKSQKISCRALYEGNFDLNFLFMGPQILIAEHYERDFDMIFHVKAAQNFAAERYGKDFDMILHFEAAQNFVA